jgi:hypothetical protein
MFLIPKSEKKTFNIDVNQQVQGCLGFENAMDRTHL